jgi:hypothetical protein
MSDLPASTLGYHAVVTEYFLARRGTGLLVSPLDEELVAQWERQGIPVAVVCQGVRDGLAALAERGARPPRSLRALRLAVEDAWRAYRSGRVGEAPPPPAEDAAAEARLAAARARLAEGGHAAPAALRDGYRAAWRALEPAAHRGGSPLARAEEAIARADAHLLAAWVASLPRAERSALGRRVRDLAGPRIRGASRRAHREALRLHLLDAARRAGLTCLRGSV